MPFLIGAPPPKKNPGSVPVQPCIFPKARTNEQTTEKRPIGDIFFIKLRFGYFGCDDQEKNTVYSAPGEKSFRQKSSNNLD